MRYPNYPQEPSRPLVRRREPLVHYRENYEILDEPVPRPPRPLPPRPRQPVSFTAVIGITLLALSAVLLVNYHYHIIDFLRYGYPRIFQTDANVGHGDKTFPESHFIAINNHGLVEVVEIPGDPGKGKTMLYVVGRIGVKDADLVPVTLSFHDIDADGRPDMEIEIQGGFFIFYNTGSSFVKSK